MCTPLKIQPQVMWFRIVLDQLDFVYTLTYHYVFYSVLILLVLYLSGYPRQAQRHSSVSLTNTGAKSFSYHMDQHTVAVRNRTPMLWFHCFSGVVNRSRANPILIITLVSWHSRSLKGSTSGSITYMQWLFHRTEVEEFAGAHTLRTKVEGMKS